MQTDSNRPDSHSENVAQESKWNLLGSPWLIGTLLTVAFYAAIPYLPIQREFATRYFCGHWIEYATTGLFFLGMSILARKGLALSRERQALQFDLTSDEAAAGTPTSPAVLEFSPATERAERLLRSTSRLPAPLRRTMLVERVRDLSQYVLGRQSSDNLEDHLKYLAELAAERLHGTYALVRTVTWAVPILGFLGTVIGITMAIANVTPEQLESSLGEVTAGLAVAFDTTALSLTLSMLLVFATFVIERAEQQILADVEHYGVNRLAPCFPSAPSAHSPWAEAETQAAHQLLRQSEALIRWQTELWQKTFEDLRSRWLESTGTQQLDFASALSQGMATTLQEHGQQLSGARQEFLTAFRETAAELGAVRAELVQSAATQQAAFRQEVDELWQKVHEQMSEFQRTQHAQVADSVQLITGAMSEWHGDLAQTNEAMHSQLHELRRHAELLQQIVGQESELVRLQGTLQQNLHTLQGVEAFEETMHSLSAAVHLLSVRARPHAA